MKVCPQCTSTRIRYSHTHSAVETFFRTLLGYRYYRYQQCHWRGKGRPTKKSNKLSSKISTWKVIALYAFAIVLVLFIVVIGVGDATPPPPP